jgi:hypothetical protein
MFETDTCMCVHDYQSQLTAAVLTHDSVEQAAGPAGASAALPDQLLSSSEGLHHTQPQQRLAHRLFVPCLLLGGGVLLTHKSIVLLQVSKAVKVRTLQQYTQMLAG